MSKVKIGIAANKLYMENGLVPSMYRAYVNNEYVESVEKAGGVPVLLPVITDLEDIEVQLKGLDGLIISGGYDIDPTLYNEEPIIQCGFTMREVDIYYIALIKMARELNIPIFGICKGIQAINVAFGGSLYQDLNSQKKNVIKHSQNAPKYSPTHFINIEKGSWLEKTFGEKANVNSYHHQSIKDLAKGFKITATASDGVIEAIESKEGSFVCGVQFHPEMMAQFDNEFMVNLFKNFFEKCK